MVVTREFRRDAIGKNGIASIRVVFCWNGHRLRLASSEKCHQAHWNEKKQEVKDKPNAYATQRNLVLENWTKAGKGAYQDALARGRQLTPPEMKAEILRRYALLAAGIDAEPEGGPGLPPLAPQAPEFLATMDEWLEHQARKISLASGRRLNKKTVTALRRTRNELQRLAAHQGTPLTFADMSPAFYAAFRDYVLDVRGHSINTFGDHIKRLKSFLSWAEDQDITVNRRYRKFESPENYQGVDALTQRELLTLAALDLDTPAVHAYVDLHLVERPRASADHRGGRNLLTHAQHLERLQHTRDKLLQCCYFGLRLGDADRLAPEHLAGEVARIRASKTGVLCVIPYFDDDVFKPVSLVESYADQDLATCLPYVRQLERYLPHLQRLSGLKRVKLTSRIGRKTFATLKIYQGVPKAQVMLATGHQTERSFNRYLGIDEQELIEAYRKTARRVA
ncbi:phage integrase SAM-like domain-containing protein [Hymenobacter defluvii]|uniref:Phage integrase SAM-like domain-containing protein n=1 Tax=Hymenobacter defluvii TaxID=2054411 RepID=A0ABS3TBR4_9BACT|nr:phage integrase SAM-like domain-containing protein [Hymenobacter defluvii]MBO3270788.1 phage integrase SAM-like domain-containing protein [Hymenobacter defluvii]